MARTFSHSQSLPDAVASDLVRGLYFVGGAICFGLACAGALLPLLPCTPFLLLASYCLLRSSPRWHARLRNSPYFGGLIRDWESQRGIRPSVRKSALGVLAVTGAVSLWSVRWSPLMAAVLVGGMLIGATCILRLPVIAEDPA